MSENDHDEPQADVIEQRQQAAPEPDEPDREQELGQTRLPLEADAADAADQARIVELDEEEYR